MDAAFAWIGQFVEWLAAFFPRWVIVDTRQAGLFWRRGHTVIVKGPGWWWYWPLLTRLEVIETARRAVDLRDQTVTTTDGKTIAIGGVIVFEVSDVEKFAARTNAPHDTIHSIVVSAMQEVCCKKAWADMQAEQQSGKLDRDLRREVKEWLDGYGVAALKVTLTDLSPCRVFKLVQN